MLSTTTGARAGGSRSAPAVGAVVLAAAWVVGATAAQLARSTGFRAYQTIWAEDGTRFLQAALRDDVLETATTPFGSYLHVAPRLVAALVAPLPPDWWALLLAGSAALSVSLLSVYVFVASEPLLPPAWARAALTVLFVLLPSAGWELTAVLANLHWYLIFAAFVASAAPPRTWGGAIVAGGVTLLAVLSDPQAALFLPVAVVRSWRGPVPARSVPVAMVAGALAQLPAVLTSPPGNFTTVRPAELPDIAAHRILGPMVVGHGWMRELYASGRLAWFAAGLVVGTLLLWAFAQAGRSGRSWMVVAGVYAAFFATVPFLIRGTEDIVTDVFSLQGARYVYLPQMFLYLALLIGLVDHARRGGAVRLLPAVVVLGLTGVLVVTSFGVISVRTWGPEWSVTLRQAREVCRDLPPGRSAALDGDRIPDRPGHISMPVAPNVEPPAFFVLHVPCDRLVRAPRAGGPRPSPMSSGGPSRLTERYDDTG